MSRIHISIKVQVPVVFISDLVAIRIDDNPVPPFRCWHAIACCAKVEYLDHN
jgi:hypothetical protein